MPERVTRIIAWIVIAVGIFFASLPEVAAEEVWVGIWKLSRDKSPKAAGRPRSQIVTMTAAWLQEESLTRA